MRRLTPLLVPALLALALPAGAHAAVVGGPVAHGQGKDDTTRYWTDARMRNATPREKGKGKPGGGGGGGGFSSTSFEPSSYPPQQGKVFMTDGGINYVCSGTAVTKGSTSIVWTAGHCVWQDSGAGPVTNFMFVPAYKNGTAPYGRFAATALYTTAGWAGSSDFGDDSGAAVVGTNASGTSLAAAVGGRTIAFNTTRNQAYDLYGYPAAGKFNGQTMRECHTSWLRDDTSTSPAAMGVGCDMTGGSSGGGWITSTGLLVSNVSYGYSSLKNVLFGPHLETQAQALYDTAG